MSTAAALAKAALLLITDEKTRKKVGWVLVAILSPVILIIALICSIFSGGASHNNATVAACFYGSSYSDQVPAEFRTHVAQMQTAFSRLDSAVASVNAQMEDGNGLDPTRVKAVFYTLCFGEAAPSSREASDFVACFYTTEQRLIPAGTELADGTVTTEDEEYAVAVPLSQESAYANLAALLGRAVTAEDKDNIRQVYTMIAGSAAGSDYDGSYLRGTDHTTELDISGFTDPATKNAADLVAYAIHAWESGWGYVWGTFGQTLTESLLESKIRQYPDGVGSYEDVIRSKWLGGRTADCIGLIKGYGWLDTDSMTIRYGTNGMPDIGADAMYRNASVKGTIGTIPETPGLAVWKSGHIGVYIGNGEVIEAMGTHYGVVKTQLADRNWTAWLEIPYIQYD